jgi:signal peptide peptidase SppA
MRITNELEAAIDQYTIANIKSCEPGLPWDYSLPWAIHESQLSSILQLAPRNLNAMRESSQQSMTYRRTADGVAVFSLQGTMTKMPNWLVDGTSAVMLRMQIREARRDPSIVGGMLVIDSVGGQTRGVTELCEDIRKFCGEKPLYAFIEDQCAAVAVVVASQATKRYANQDTAQYGSIGCYSVLIDYSEKAARAGIKVHVVRAGEFKGMGTPGTEISEAQLSEQQRIINAINEGMLKQIAEGLGKPLAAIRQFADGKTILARDAVAAGLINGVRSYEQAYEDLLSMAKRQPAPSNNAQSPIRAAIVSEPKQAVLTHADKARAFRSNVDGLVAKGLQRRKAIHEAALRHPELHAAFVAGETVEPSRLTTTERANVLQEWGEIVAAEMKTRGCDRHMAIRFAAQANPEAYSRMLTASARRYVTA